MSEIRYQVFVSSTYADLKEERGAVYQAIMEMNCIPVGMEIFPASNDQQFEFIKSVIDESDYYILIIGGRYGSVDDSGLSYTEKEFDYALSKELEICTFIHSDPGKIISEKTDRNEKAEKKLANFKAKVSHDRLVKFWNDPKDLPGKVVTSLNSAIRRKPAIGWIRGDRQAPPQIIDDILRLQDENSQLRKALERSKNAPPSKEVSNLNKKIRVIYEEAPPSGLTNAFLTHNNALGLIPKPTTRSVELTVGEIIERLGYSLAETPNTLKFDMLIPQPRSFGLGLAGPHKERPKNIIVDDSKKKIELALTALGYIKIVDRTAKTYIYTDDGRRALLEIITT